MKSRLFSRRNTLGTALILLSSALGISQLLAGDKTWTGLGTNNNWTTGSNWSSVVASGDSVLFGGSIRLTPSNDFTAGTVFSNITFNPGAGAFVLLGNPVTLAGNITNNLAANTVRIGMDLALTNNSFIVVVSNGPPSLTITGAVSGPFSLIKAGPGLLTLGGANTFTGTVTVADGTLRVDHDSALGATNGATTVNSGATLNVGGPDLGVNGLDLGTEQIVVSGSGVSGAGAIISTYDQAQQNALQRVTLAGNATFGGTGPWTATGANPGRWDIRGTPATAFLSTGGQPYGLTKTGSNEVRLAGITVDPALGNIDLVQGALGIEGATTSLGNPINTVTVYPGASLELISATNRLNKNLVFIGDGVTANVDNRSGNNTILGPVTLSNQCIFLVRGSGTTLTNRGPISGSGGLTKTGGATGGSLLVLMATNTYTGPTLVNVATLVLLANGSIPNSPNITVASGATLDVSGRVDGTLRLVSGQTLSGTGTVIGSVTNLGEAHILPGATNATGTLNVTGNVWTGGGYTTIIPVDSSTNSLLNVSGNLVYAGMLFVEDFSAGTWHAGRRLKMFNAASYSGAFASIVTQPPLDPGLVWDTSTLALDGSMTVAALPSITCPANITTNIPGTNVVVNYANPTVVNGGLQSSVPASGSVFLPGSTLVTCTATNAYGTDTCTFMVTVLRTSGPPIIGRGLVSQAVPVGSNALFAAIATGSSPMTYQWFKDQAPIPGATGSSLAFSPVAASNAGYYAVTASNAFGLGASPTVLLRALPTQGQGGDPNGPTDTDFGDLPAAYAACWRYFSYDANCNLQSSDVKIASSVTVSYPTMLQDNGARHFFLRDGIWLGTDVSATYDGTPSAMANLDPLTAGGLSSGDPSQVPKEENGIRRVSAWNDSISSVVDPRFTPAGKRNLNLFSSGCKIPGQTVFFTVEGYNSYNYSGVHYCDPMYLNLWIDYGDATGVSGTPDGKFQGGEYVLVDQPLWGADMLMAMSWYGVQYPYDTSLADNRAVVRDNLGCGALLPDIGKQPYANYGLQLFQFTIPPSMTVPTCGKQAFARFRLSRKPLDVNGANPYHLQTPPWPAPGTPDPTVGLVDDSGEVEDYSFFLTPSCPTLSAGSSLLCLTAASLPSAAVALPFTLSTEPPPCGTPPSPQLLGFSSDLDPLTGCEFPIVAPTGWCGTGGMMVNVANPGPNNLTGVRITYQVPTNGIFFGANASQGTTSELLGTVTFDLGEVDAGEVAQLALHVLPRASDTLYHQFTATADQSLLNGNTASFSNFVTIVSPSTGACAPGANLIVNGSFESPTVASDTFSYVPAVTGWTTTDSLGKFEIWTGTGGGVPAYGGILPQNGNQHLEINADDGLETVSQVVGNLNTNCPTTFCFYYTGRFPAPANNKFTVQLSGPGFATQSAILTPAAYSGSWQLYTTTFLPPQTLTIKFIGAPADGNAGGAHIDNVELFQQGPNITCPANISLTVAASSVPVPVYFANPTIAYGALQSCVPPSGSLFPVGTTTVICTATNACASTTCSFNVTVQQAACGAGANLVNNGSFETPPVANNTYAYLPAVPGWTTTDSQGQFEIWTGTGGGAPAFGGILPEDGNQQLEINALDPDETVSQVINNLSTNCPATFCFYYTGRFPNPSNNTFTVELSGPGFATLLAPLSPVAYGVGGWQIYVATFVPPASLTIKFRGLPADGNAGGAHIDNVSLVQQGPIITCQPPITTNICGASVVVTYPNPMVTGGALKGCVPASGSVFPLGTTTVTCTATNGCGTNTCTFTVTVAAVPALAITCPANITTNICGTSVVVNYANPTVTGGGLRSSIPPSGSVFPLGTTVVTCTATNRCSTNTCTFNVTVIQSSPNRVINGSFEVTSPPMTPNSFNFGLNPTTGVSGWTTATTNFLEVWCNTVSGIPASAGTNQLEICAQGNDETVSQVVTNLNTNCLATLCFDYTGRFGLSGGTYNNDFTLQLSGGYSATVPFDPAIYSVGGWQNYCTSFVPTTPTVTISFHGHPHFSDGTSATQGGAHIDNVSLKQCCDSPPCTPKTPLYVEVAGFYIVLSWNDPNYRLQGSLGIPFPVNWIDIPGTSPVSLPISGPLKFFRLVCP